MKKIAVIVIEKNLILKDMTSLNFSQIPDHNGQMNRRKTCAGNEPTFS